jgi:tRNA pseudouridine55 synthase
MTRRSQASEYHGLLVLDKPSGMTSRDAVNQIQRRLPRGSKIGHTGTLDPLATGVLVVCLGHATRLAEYVQAMSKTYRSTFLLGATSDTDDANGKVTPSPNVQPLDRLQIERNLLGLIGDIEQTPPLYSAVKVGGQRAHDLARDGTDMELASRPVKVHCIDILSYDWPRLEVEVHCGKGTYIRSLARDLGSRLGCGGLVEVLRRTRVGSFTTDQAIVANANLELIRANLRPMTDAVQGMEHVTATDEDVARLRHGQPIRWAAAGDTAVLNEAGELVAICEPRDGFLCPVKVIPPIH